MTLSPTLQPILLRHQTEIHAALRRTMMRVSNAATRTQIAQLQPYYGQMEYHLGWVNADFSPATGFTGKLLRPTLLLLAYEAAGAWGDDIQDSDTERHHRATLWKLWGIPQAINAGDGLFALSRLALWGVLDEGVETSIAARLGELLDRTCLTVSEGQYLDLSFEGHQDISLAMYVDMISRKTAALMSCAAEMGALLATRDQDTIDRLRSFGQAIGIAFQVRDDLLGVWASKAELGKTSAGDIYRRKKSWPILHALEHARERDQHILQTIYEQEAPITGEQVETVLTIFARTQSKIHCQKFLAEQCLLAHEALLSVPRNESAVATRALADLTALIHFIESAARE